MNNQDLDVEKRLHEFNILVKGFKQAIENKGLNAESKADMEECLVLIGMLAVDLLPKVNGLVKSLKDEVARESRFRGLAGKPADQV
jgi:hypothetical protein